MLCSNNAVFARMSALVPVALGAFDQPEVAYVWFTSPNVMLGGLVPIDLVLRGDIDALRVRHVLADICRTR